MTAEGPNGLKNAATQSRAASSKVEMSASTVDKAMSWDELSKLVSDRGYETPDIINGPTNAQSRLRLFGHKEEDVRVTLYRDHHAWCPYCQKIWLWLEEHQIPYRIDKITMFCYGKKESWYKGIVPSGMLPAVAIDG